MVINWDDFKVRCSAISKVMADSRSNPTLTEKQAGELAKFRTLLESGLILSAKQQDVYAFLCEKEKNGSKAVLSDTCIEYLMVEYAWMTRGMIPTGKESLDLLAIKKGNMCEIDAWRLLCQVDKLPYKQHKDRIYNDYLSGQIDLYLGADVMSAIHISDLKNSWDYPVFLKMVKKKLDSGHEEQVQGYMDITGARTGSVTRTLVDCPPEIIEDMKWKVAKKMNALTIESPEFVNEWKKWERSLVFNSIPNHQRVHKVKIEPFSQHDRQALYDRVKVCRQWLSDFHEEYQKMNLN